MFEVCVRERTGKETCLVGRRGPLFSAKLIAIETLEAHNLPQVVLPRAELSGTQAGRVVGLS